MLVIGVGVRNESGGGGVVVSGRVGGSCICKIAGTVGFVIAVSVVMVACANGVVSVSMTC